MEHTLSPESSRPPLRCLRVVFAVILLLTLTAGAFSRTPFMEFIHYDDTVYLMDNPHVQAGLSFEGVRWAFSTFYADNWHPLTWLSHMADCSLYGMNPAGHHITNVILHGLNACLLFFFFLHTTRLLWPAFFMAALFAVHPLRLESVAWAAERKDVLSALFWMLSMLCYAWYAAKPGVMRYLSSLLCMALGLMAKPMLVTLPVVLLLLDSWPLGRFQRRDVTLKRAFLEKIPFFFLSAASSVTTMFAQQNAMGDLFFYSIPVRIMNTLFSYVSYLGKMFWPVDLAPFYPHPGDTLPVWIALVSGAALLGICVGVFLLRKRAPFLVTGWVWYLVTLVPVIGLIQVGQQSLADRYTYIPGIGICMMAVYGLDALLLRRTALRRVAFFSGLLFLVGLSFFTWRHSRFWVDSVTLFTHAVNVAPSNVAHNNLGNMQYRQRKYSQAIHNFEKALELNPHDTIPYHNLGLSYFKVGRYDEAERIILMMLQLRPELIYLHQYLGDIAMVRNNPALAVQLFHRALAGAPGDAYVLGSLAEAYLQLGDGRQALAFAQAALAKNPAQGKARAVMDSYIEYMNQHKKQSPSK